MNQEIRSRLSRFEYMDPTVWKRSMNVWDGAKGAPFAGVGGNGTRFAGLACGVRCGIMFTWDGGR